MLKTEQILNAKFTPVSKGTYSAEEVDAFLKVVAQSYDALSNEKNELIKKISILADKIESYRSDEEAIKLSLLDAHRMAETINKNASIKSETLIGDAETRAQLIVDGANRQSAKAIEEAKEQAKEIVDNAKNAVASLTERAQKETDEAISSAQAKAASIVANAEAEAEKIIGTSREAYEFYTSELAKAQASAAEFKATMTALCNDQLSIIEAVPETVAEPLAFEGETVEEEKEVEIPEDIEEATVADTEEVFAQLDEEIAELENAVDEVEEESSVVDEEQTEDVPSEDEDEFIEVDLADEEEEDLFSMIDDIDLDNFVTDSIPESLDDLVVSASVEETEDVEPETAEIDQEETEEDVFDGFKIDLDSLGLDDDSEDDDDITSLFDSMFDE